jgi:hypothetical protein
VVRHNRGGQRGGGVESLNDVRINRSSFIGNTAGSGGGLYIDARADMNPSATSSTLVAANSSAADIGGTTTVETQWLQYFLIGNRGSARW